MRYFDKEIMKMFTDCESFYYCPTGDLTNSIQQQHKTSGNLRQAPDDRFFWNKNMLQDLIDVDVRTN